MAALADQDDVADESLTGQCLDNGVGGRSGWSHRAAGAGCCAVNEAMPVRLVFLQGVQLEHAGASQVRVLLADYELRLLAPCGGEQLTLPVEAGGGRRRAWRAGLSLNGAGCPPRRGRAVGSAPGDGS